MTLSCQLPPDTWRWLEGAGAAVGGRVRPPRAGTAARRAFEAGRRALRGDLAARVLAESGLPPRAPATVLTRPHWRPNELHAALRLAALGLSHAEIGARLGKPPGGVKLRLHRARRADAKKVSSFHVEHGGRES